MDKEVAALLKKWGLYERLFETFDAEEVDVYVLERLDETEILRLIPKPLKLRLQFKEKLKAWIEERKHCEIINFTKDNGEELGNFENSDILTIDSQSLGNTLPDARIEKFQPGLSAGVNSPQVVPDINERQPETDPSQALALVRENNYSRVLNILNSSHDGRAILHMGTSRGGALKDVERKRLSRLVITHELEKNPNRIICNEEFLALSEQIIKIFPKEAKEVFYCQYRPRTEFHKKRNSSGKLYESYVSRCRTLLERGVRNRSRALNRQHSAHEMIKQK